MLVLLLQNLDISAGLVNGSQGKIIGFEDYDPKMLPVPSDKKDQLVRLDIVSPDAPVLRGDDVRWRQGEIRRFINRAATKKWPVVQFENVKDPVTIYADCSIRTLRGRKKMPCFMARTQIPLMAGWAMTVHKAQVKRFLCCIFTSNNRQGMTLDRVEMNLFGSFASGQVYVARMFSCLRSMFVSLTEWQLAEPEA